ncbi:MAG: transposase [Planctomycetota bacterium]|nr:transposase [Planctomycetota bacterium]
MFCTTEGACLERLIAIAKPILLKSERKHPIVGPGRKPEIPDWVLALLILSATLKKKKTKSAQFRWISSNRRHFERHLDGHRLPSRSTYFDRFKKAHSIMDESILLMGQKAVHSGWADASITAIDKSLMVAKGPKWWKGDRLKNRIPKKLRGVDQDSQWGFSSHHGWVQGYSFEVVVSCGKNGVVFPLVASADVASMSEHRSFGQKIRRIPQCTRYVLADAGYDNNEFADQIELKGERKTGKWFLCPQNSRGQKGKLVAPKGEFESKRKYATRLRRAQRRMAFKSKLSQKHFRPRSQCIEPFNEWFKSAFELNERVWHRGIENNRTQVLSCIFAYQVLVSLNCKQKKPSGQIKPILDAL